MAPNGVRLAPNGVKFCVNMAPNSGENGAKWRQLVSIGSNCCQLASIGVR